MWTSFLYGPRLGSGVPVWATEIDASIVWIGAGHARGGQNGSRRGGNRPRIVSEREDDGGSCSQRVQVEAVSDLRIVVADEQLVAIERDRQRVGVFPVRRAVISS